MKMLVLVCGLVLCAVASLLVEPRMAKGVCLAAAIALSSHVFYNLQKTLLLHYGGSRRFFIEAGTVVLNLAVMGLLMLMVLPVAIAAILLAGAVFIGLVVAGLKKAGDMQAHGR